jgi:hypothetical protein
MQVIFTRSLLLIITDRNPKAFERCRIGDFNCSQGSLTSANALAALRELPQSNPNLHNALTKSELNCDDEAEPDFSEDNDTVEDDSDIPVAVVAAHVISGGAEVLEGFGVNEVGSLVCSAAVEDIGEGDDVAASPAQPQVMGRGHRRKTVSHSGNINI